MARIAVQVPKLKNKPHLFHASYKTRHKQFIRYILTCVHSLLLATLLFCPPPCSAGDELLKTVSTPRFTLYIEADEDIQSNSNVRLQNIATEAIELLDDNFDELSRIFSVKPKKKVVLRFLSPSQFHKQTGSPSWTSAMYYRGEITIPIHTDKLIDFGQLKRALRHEYVHAVVAELSGSRCPAWLDEGIAQIIEGKPNPILGPALRKWLSVDNPIPLSWLETGFTTLDEHVVPPAYAESLFATRTLINSNGFGAVSNYLTMLKNGKPLQVAFSKAFGETQKNFENNLARQLRRWAKGRDKNP